MRFDLKIIFALMFVFYVKTYIGQTNNIDTSYFYHLSFNDQERLPEGPNNHLLFWYTKKYIPNTYFVVEHFCWGRWVKRRKISETSILGKREYFGRTGSKCEYRFKIQPHSGENRMRVLLLNDSNVCLAISKELKWISPLTPKVTYTNNKRSKEIKFSAETEYEILDLKGTLIKEGQGSFVSYAELDDGAYTLNYDNASASIVKKN